MKKAAVVILNWNGQKLMEQFLPSLIAHTPGDIAEVIVADNASTDDSVSFLEKQYPALKRIVLDENYGFAGGYNRAFSELDNEYVVLLNSDVEVGAGWLKQAIDYLDMHKDIVALQPKIIAYRDKAYFEYAGASGGFMDKYGYPFCRGRILATVEKDFGQYDSPIDILWASGACLFIRLREFKEAGGLDENFFAHQEEIDLCWRLRVRGKRIVCLPQSVVYHVGGATLKMEHPRKTFLNFRNNLLMLYKNLPQKYYHRVMFTRFFLDYLAAFQFLMKGHPKNAASVFKARLDFRQRKKDYKEIRKLNLESSVMDIPPEIFRKSLVFNYYLGNKKKYSQLLKK